MTMNPNRRLKIIKANGAGLTRLLRSNPRSNSSLQTIVKPSSSSSNGILTLMLIAPRLSLLMELGTYYQLRRKLWPTMQQCSRFRLCRLCSTRRLSFSRHLLTTIHICTHKTWALLIVLMGTQLSAVAMNCRHNLVLLATRALPNSYRLTRVPLETKECK